MSRFAISALAIFSCWGLIACSQDASTPPPKTTASQPAAILVPADKTAAPEASAPNPPIPATRQNQQPATCVGGDGKQYALADMLEWCSRDHGFNEGAKCGAEALSGAGIVGVPAIATNAILGNTWDRTNMIGAAKAAAKTHAGSEIDSKAAAAATCCQIHNGPIHQCLKGNPTAVLQWLQR